MISAIAASVSICAVAGSTPGMSDDQFDTRTNRKIEPISARNGAGSLCIVSRIWLSMADTMSSSVAWVFEGMSFRRRVARAERPARTAMTAQETTTGSVMPTGPIMNSGSIVSGDFTRASDGAA